MRLYAESRRTPMLYIKGREKVKKLFIGPFYVFNHNPKK
jgi:hypothetical protein